jgi:pyruvate dehydrogenase phosphatase
LSGSCALLTFYDSESKNLKVACTGDSRAVFGSRSPDGKIWITNQLSQDQTGSNPQEADRLRKEHPGEEDSVIRNGRVLGGLEPTRAFGDARYKWPVDIQNKIYSLVYGRKINSSLKSPPYVTASPVITTTKVEPDKQDSFVVIATDGLWERLSSEEVVSLVGGWLDRKEGRINDGFLSRWLGGSNSSTVVSSAPVQGQKSPKNRQKRFVYVDENASTHIIRNALGGGNEDELSAIVSIPAPMSRYYRHVLIV